jgi:hypothetical protein
MHINGKIFYLLRLLVEQKLSYLVGVVPSSTVIAIVGHLLRHLKRFFFYISFV